MHFFHREAWRLFYGSVDHQGHRTSRIGRHRHISAQQRAQRKHAHDKVTKQKTHTCMEHACCKVVPQHAFDCH